MITPTWRTPVKECNEHSLLCIECSWLPIELPACDMMMKLRSEKRSEVYGPISYLPVVLILFDRPRCSICYYETTLSITCMIKQINSSRRAPSPKTPETTKLLDIHTISVASKLFSWITPQPTHTSPKQSARLLKTMSQQDSNRV